jgi:hypothetical protein
MKRILLMIVVVCFALTSVVAQEPTFLKGDKVLNIGLGLGSTWYSGSFYQGQVPPLSASLEFGVVDNVLEEAVIGIGPYVGYSSYKYEYLDWGWKYSNIIVGVRGNLHYPLADKLDTYAGLLLGYRILTAKEFGTSPGGYDYSASSSGVATAGYVGARYYLKESFGLMVELGYGITYLNLGIALRM